MAQKVKIAGALFSDVPSISVPDENDVYHSFVDINDTTATASDVASGEVFYTASGTRTVGTAVAQTVNDGTLTIQRNGTTVGTFTANQSGNTTANITVPIGADEIEFSGSSGDITAQSTDVEQAIKALDDATQGKQATLVSGTNIKTVAGNSLLGSGNVSIDASDVSLNISGFSPTDVESGIGEFVNKILISSPTAGNFVSLTSSGAFVDSGVDQSQTETLGGFDLQVTGHYPRLDGFIPVLTAKSSSGHFYLYDTTGFDDTALSSGQDAVATKSFVLANSGTPSLTIKGTVDSPTVNTGSITDHQFNYALSSDRKWGMIWGTAVVKGAGASSTRVECSTGITVSPAPSVETIIDGVVAGYTYTAFSQRPYLAITTSGEVIISWRCSTNNNPIQFNTGLVRFADFY